MRSPASLGLGSGGLPFIKASDIVGAYIAITGAVARVSAFKTRDGQERWEIVFSCRLLADQFAPDGKPVMERFRFSLDYNDARQEYVAAFQETAEEIGPLVIVQLASPQIGMPGAIVFNDATGMLDIWEPPAPPKALGGPTTRPAGQSNEPTGRATSQTSPPMQRSTVQPPSPATPAAPRSHVASNRFAPGRQPASQAPRATEQAPEGWPDDFDFNAPDPDLPF